MKRTTWQFMKTARLSSCHKFPWTRPCSLENLKPVGNLIDKKTVVADDDHGAWEIRQGALHHLRAGQVEVIGWFVQKNCRCTREQLFARATRALCPPESVPMRWLRSISENCIKDKKRLTCLRWREHNQVAMLTACETLSFRSKFGKNLVEVNKRTTLTPDTWPSFGLISPLRVCNKVVFPQPLGPTMAIRSPRWTSKLTSLHIIRPR